MAKIICGILLLAAFLYALTLILAKRDINKIKKSFEGRNGFVIATFIFCAIIIFVIYGRGEKPKQKPEGKLTCYLPMLSSRSENVKDYSQLIPMIKTAWLALDAQKEEKFSKILDNAVEKGAIKKDVSTLLLSLYNELAGEIYKKNNFVTCYKMHTHWRINTNSIDELLKQLELLNKMKTENKLSDDVVNKIMETMAYDIETLKEFRDILKEHGGDEKFIELAEKYKDKTLRVSEDAKRVSEIIVEIEKTREKWDLIKGRKKFRR